MTHVLDRLHEDHEKVSQLIRNLRDGGDGSEKTRRDLCGKIKDELEAHTSFEEEVFYPAVRKQSEDAEEQVNEAIEEHNEVEQILQQIENLDPSDDEFSELVEELEDSVAAHVRREEDEIFPIARQALDEEEGERMGQRHDTMIAEHMRSAHA